VQRFLGGGFKRMQKFASLGAIFAIPWLLTACGERDMQDLEQFVAKKNTVEGIPPKPIREPEPYIAFEYPGHSRDPFDSSVLKVRVEEPGDDPSKPQGADLIDWNRTLEYLESFPLDSLRMVGTLEQNDTRWALIRTPDETIQRVKKDNYMGLSRGRIMEITQSRVELVEIVPDGFGGWKKRENEMALSE